jgi:hypothetical protein
MAVIGERPQRGTVLKQHKRKLYARIYIWCSIAVTSMSRPSHNVCSLNAHFCEISSINAASVKFRRQLFRWIACRPQQQNIMQRASLFVINIWLIAIGTIMPPAAAAVGRTEHLHTLHSRDRPWCHIKGTDSMKLSSTFPITSGSRWRGYAEHRIDNNRRFK